MVSLIVQVSSTWFNLFSAKTFILAKRESGVHENIDWSLTLIGPL